jgi:hypothetical protein
MQRTRRFYKYFFFDNTHVIKNGGGIDGEATYKFSFQLFGNAPTQRNFAEVSFLTGHMLDDFVPFIYSSG